MFGPYGFFTFLTLLAIITCEPLLRSSCTYDALVWYQCCFEPVYGGKIIMLIEANKIVRLDIFQDPAWIWTTPTQEAASIDSS